MKRILLIILTLVFSSKLYAQDQKAMMYGQATANLAGAGMTTVAGIGYQSPCNAGESAVVTAAAASLACWQAGLSYATAGLTTTMAGVSIVYAETMDWSGGKAALPSTVNTRDLTAPNGAPVKPPQDLRDIADAQKDLIDKKLKDLKAKGYDMEKFLANPEAFGVSKEQLKEMQSEVAQIPSQGNSLDSEKNMKTTRNELSSGADYSRDIATVDASGGSISGTENFNFDTVLSGFMPKGASENSAPGYYGNVSLKVLNPTSKLSLFERVSLKLKTLM